MSASYVLTPAARKHLREAKLWSRARWGDALTAQYFQDLDQAAHYLAEHHAQHAARTELVGSSRVCVYPAREHYIIYEPIAENKVAIVAFIRQGRDVPALLGKYAYAFKKELDEIRRSCEPKT
jgi:plasmid stabilization system protein ParE